MWWEFDYIGVNKSSIGCYFVSPVYFSQYLGRSLDSGLDGAFDGAAPSVIAADPKAFFATVPDSMTGRSDGEGLGEVLGTQVSPGLSGFSEPIDQLALDGFGDSSVGSVIINHRDGDERLALGRVAGGNLRGDAEVMDQAISVATERDDGFREGSFVGSEVETAGMVPLWLTVVAE